MKKLLIGRKLANKPIENIFRGIAHMVFTMFFHSFLQFPSGSIFETTKWAQSTNKQGFEEDSKVRNRTDKVLRLHSRAEQEVRRLDQYLTMLN